MACNPHADGTPMISEMLSSGNCRVCLPPCGLMRTRFVNAFARASSFATVRCTTYPPGPAGLCNSQYREGGGGCEMPPKHWLQLEISYGGGSCLRPNPPFSNPSTGDAQFVKINPYTQVLEYSDVIRSGSTIREQLTPPFTTAAAGIAENNFNSIALWNELSASQGGPDVIGSIPYDPIEAATRAPDNLNAGKAVRPELWDTLPINRPTDLTPVEIWRAWRDNDGIANLTDVTQNSLGLPAYLRGSFSSPVMNNEILRTSGEFIDWQAIVVDPLPGEGIIVSASKCDTAGIYPPGCAEARFWNRALIVQEAGFGYLQVDSYIQTGIVWIKGNWCLRRFLL